MATCKKCGWWSVFCHCTQGHGGALTHDWIRKGEWEHIDPTQPHMKIDSKEQLIRECAKRGQVPKAFMKPRSQGKGWEAR